ncbi:MAG: CHAT domain-containing protein [Microcoleaceae cyanobacterium]
MLERSRNQEFSTYLGIEPGDIRDRPVLQDSMEQVEAETGEVYVIVYVVARDQQLELILVPSSGLPKRYTIPGATRAEVLSTIRDLQIKITSQRERRTTRYQEPAQRLYEWILEPIEADLEEFGATTLLFSLGQGLRSLPIATLWDGDRHLIEKYNYSLIPSTSLIDIKHVPADKIEVLAMGASVFEDQAPLPAVPTEVKTITNLWPGRSFLNESFTLENLRVQRRVTEYEIIHLATHADFQPGVSENSYIQLWDGRLPMDQLPSLNWDQPPVELLVLSACRTAIGDQNAELGFAGLAVQAGVKSAIASLWYVNDQSTLALMSEFYNDLQTAPIKAVALREAQLAMLGGKVEIESGQLRTEDGLIPLPPELANLESEDFIHPYYWSGFTLIGAPW